MYFYLSRSRQRVNSPGERRMLDCVISTRRGVGKHFRCVAMDSNKDEAERCIKIALNAIANDQQDKARKFLDKAQRLFPTEHAKSRSNKGLFRRGFGVGLSGHGCEVHFSLALALPSCRIARFQTYAGICSLTPPIQRYLLSKR